VRRTWPLWAGALAVFAAAALYRFLLLGGQLGGFENDEFLVISRAAALLRGEWPSRDFVDPGYPLAYVASALAMRAAGGTLLGHAMLTASMLGLGSALTFVIAARASGSRVVGLLFAVVQIALGPRLYNYPKIVLYALAVLGWWSYVEAPSRLRLGLLALLTVVAFLFRHDHGLYIGVGTGVLLAVLTHRAGPQSTLRAAAFYGAVTLACVAPYLVYLQRYGGVVEHVRAGAEFSRIDRDRTALRWPSFDFDPGAKAFEFGAPPVEARARVKVRWREPGPSLGDVETFVKAHDLRPHGSTGKEGAEFEVRDDSPDVLRALALDPLVADTQNIDRTRWTIRERPALGTWDRLRRDVPLLRVHLAPGLLRAVNAVPFVYYVWLALPWVAVAVAALAIRRHRDVLAWQALYMLAPIVVVTLVLNQWFLRGTLQVRLADVSVLAAALGGYLWRAATPARRPLPWPAIATRTVLVVVWLGVTVSAFALGDVLSNLRVITDGRGLPGMRARAAAVVAQLATPGPVLAAEGANTSAVMRLADYLHDCLDTGQRALVVNYMPEVYYFADRQFAGGQVDVRAGYLMDPRDQAVTIARLKQQEVPIVVTEARQDFESRYRPESPVLLAYLDEAYRDTGDHDFGSQTFRVLLRRDLRPARRDTPAPCFQTARR